MKFGYIDLLPPLLMFYLTTWVFSSVRAVITQNLVGRFLLEGGDSVMESESSGRREEKIGWHLCMSAKG